MSGREPVAFGKAAGMLLLGIALFVVSAVLALPLAAMIGRDSGATPLLYLLFVTGGAFGGGVAIWKRSPGAGRYLGLGLMAGWALVALSAGVCIAGLNNSGL